MRFNADGTPFIHPDFLDDEKKILQRHCDIEEKLNDAHRKLRADVQDLALQLRERQKELADLRNNSYDGKWSELGSFLDKEEIEFLCENDPHSIGLVID